MQVQPSFFPSGQEMTRFKTFFWQIPLKQTKCLGDIKRDQYLARTSSVKLSFIKRSALSLAPGLFYDLGEAVEFEPVLSVVVVVGVTV